MNIDTRTIQAKDHLERYQPIIIIQQLSPQTLILTVVERTIALAYSRPGNLRDLLQKVKLYQAKRTGEKSLLSLYIF